MLCFIPACTIRPPMVTSCFQPGRVTRDQRAPWRLRGLWQKRADKWQRRPPFAHVAPRCAGQHPQQQNKTEIMHHARLIATICSAGVNSDRGPALWSLLIGGQGYSYMSDFIRTNDNIISFSRLNPANGKFFSNPAVRPLEVGSAFDLTFTFTSECWEVSRWS